VSPRSRCRSVSGTVLFDPRFPYRACPRNLVLPFEQACVIIDCVHYLCKCTQMDSSAPKNLNTRFRARRFRLFKELIDQVLVKKATCRVVDLGGTPSYWESLGGDLDWDRITVCTLNVQPTQKVHPRIESVVGDARDVTLFGDLSFDIVHSNSVIEHTGRWDDMAAMAREVRRLAPRYFVQTPYFWFPVEPHARFLFLHWMPEPWRYRILLKRSCGFWKQRSDVGAATKAIQSALLLDKRQVQFLFPDARIISEKVFGLTKSLIAIR
jgi:methyltransferase family protein